MGNYVWAFVYGSCTGGIVISAAIVWLMTKWEGPEPPAEPGYSVPDLPKRRRIKVSSYTRLA